MKTEITAGLIGGLMLGALVGFIYGQNLRKNTASNIKTEMSGGVLTVKIDAVAAAKQSIYDLLQN